MDVVVVTGAGGMGEACARRIGAGRTIVLADANQQQLDAATTRIKDAGHSVRALRTDVSKATDVDALARLARDTGRIRAVIHTAGVSPVQASPKQIVAVDVVGTALVLDAFEPLVQPDTVGVCIASMAGTLTPIDDDKLHILASTPTDKLAELEMFDAENLDPGSAYGLAKRANQARVGAASLAWGRRGGRVVSISPGVIATPMGHAELGGPYGDVMRQMVSMSGTRRLGTADDIAAVVEFLVSPAASFITGVDVLVDGGVVAALRYGQT